MLSMPSRSSDPRKRLFHIRDNIHLARTFVDGLDFEGFRTAKRPLIRKGFSGAEYRGRIVSRFLCEISGFYGTKCIMKRDEIIKKLKEREADLRAQGVAHAALFGSVARGDDRPDSDIDIMVEIAPDARIGLFQYVGIVHYLEDMFPACVDVANREGLKPLVRPSAERDAIYAF